MALKEKEFGHYAKRIDYTKVSGNLELPNLIEIQTETYDWFKQTGISEVFNEVFPIVGHEGNIILEMLDWEFKQPRRTIPQAKEESKIFEAPIYSNLKLTINSKDIEIETGIVKGEPELIKAWIEERIGHMITILKKSADVVYYDIHTGDEEATCTVTIKDRQPEKLIVDIMIEKTGEVFFGDFPLMTGKGTFIINGSEKVVVSQLVRSPGAYYKIDLNRKNGENVYYVDLIPSRGTWLEFESDNKKIKTEKEERFKNVFYVKIDKSRKVSVANLFTALGLTKEAVFDIFGDSKLVQNTYELENYTGDIAYDQSIAVQELYKKIRSGETATPDGATKYLFGLLFDKRKYDLTKAGRFKLIQKLSVENRIYNKVLAADIKDTNGKVVFSEGTLMDKENVIKLKGLLRTGACLETITFNDEIICSDKIQKIQIYTDNEARNKITNIIGIDPNATDEYITVPDIVATFSYLLNLTEGIGEVDDIDHLGNRRVRTIGELLQNQFRIGLLRIEKNVKEKMSTSSNLFKMKPSNIINNKPLSAIIGEFFNLSQLSQFMDQTNPLAELTNKRRLTALGPGGLSRERAGLEVRDVHYSHYGRICPIETPEGPNIGLINNLATYAKINSFGFIETPYRRVVNNKVTAQNDYLTADEEKNYVVAQANIRLSDRGEILDDQVIARFQGENIIAPRDEVDYVDVSPKQIVSIATSCIPFLENDDANRALMGANMQRQAIPLISPSSPYVGTGVEYAAARDSGLAIVSQYDGTVDFVDATKIILKTKEGLKTYFLDTFVRSNQGTSLTHVPLVKLGQKVEKNQILADGPSIEKGELALGQNVVVAFTTWNGYNYEDAIIVSERLVSEDVFTSIHIEEYTIERRQTKQGPEEITREIPNISENARKFLDDDGLVIIGTEVKPGDILVGKVTPKGQTQLSPEDKLLQAIFGEKSKNVKDNSLRVPNGGEGIIQAIKRFPREKYELAADVLEVIKVYIVQKRKIQEGDKMAGRHGNKGVISKILPLEDMPHLEDGTPVDIMLNPLGVPSRMNIGQVLEIHLGMAAKKLGQKVATPVFDGMTNDELIEIMNKANMKNFGKEVLVDGRTGEKFDNPVSVGVMYMLKLSHMVDDKLHARNVGPYSLITQQPLGGKAQNGGQRFGEMEVWALEAYGAAHTLREILTIKSDDIKGRTRAYEAIVKDKKIPEPGIPESFNVLTREIQGLGFNIHMIDEEGNAKNINSYDETDYVDEDLLTNTVDELEDEFDIDSFILNPNKNNFNEDDYSNGDIDEADLLGDNDASDDELENESN
ncbi:DNA-directed RNA polymerase subunit beta [Spiroplasma chrysopicola]|uniref:DNA-directed RNA polymerase subunit beta n=2 Tax=Spiroplasma chrysopicola TaxID=216933 RepID=R4U9W5_9MOLU|nr:DNA-directed RNA polymerase subunit beta [Spiroplasma chrysopicola]AGM24634.1 DNA-directed RNA polymerase subunit beta [Spiroplasma chrysopicola DF-1]